MEPFEYEENYEQNIFAKENVPFVVPCKVSSPKVGVKLISKEKVTEISYDETVGFQVVSLATKEIILISCIYNLNNQSQEQKFYLWVESRKYS